MKLTLKNFKCHRTKEIEIPDEGLISLSGDSGAGKSTILTALAYALFGKIKGKVRKPYSHGTKTASVKVELPLFGDLTVFRSSSPTRLLVTYKNQEYEDEAAQEIIEQVLGLNYDTFMASSYVNQNQESSVLTMTPTEQFNFIQKIAFDSVDEVENTKTKIKETIAFLKKDNDKREYSLKFIKDQYTRAKDLMPPKRTNPLNIDPEQLIDEVNELQEKLESLNKKIAKNRENLDVIRQIEFENSKLERESHVLKDFIDNNTQEDILQKIKTLEDELEIHMAELAAYEVVASFQAEKKKLQDEYDKFIATATKYSETQEKERSKLAKQVEKLKPDELFRIMDNSKKDYERALNISAVEKKKKIAMEQIQKLREFCVMCSDKKLSSSALPTTQSIEDELNCILTRNKNLLKMKTDKLLECPCCDAKLVLIDDQLETVEGLYNFIDELIVGDSVKILSDNIRMLQSLMRSEMHFNEELTSLGADLNKTLTDKAIDAFRKKYESNLEEWTKCNLLQHKLKEFDANMNSNTLVETMRDKILGDLENIKIREQQNPELADPSTDGEGGALKKKNVMSKVILNKTRDVSDLKIKLEEYNRNIRKHDAIIKELERRRGAYLPSKDYEEKDKSYSEALTSTMTLIRDKNKLLESSKEYIAYQRALENLEILESNLETEEYAINENKFNIEGYCALEKMCKEAEILALEHTINTINIHAQHYIEQMFTDPIVVKLSTNRGVPGSTSGSGSSKYQLSTYIEYKGAVYDSVDELSGGERQRCELAYLLALNDVLGSKIILLDECLNNLDANINTEVLTFLRERCSEKMIVVISHEAVKGVFDHEIFV